MKAILFQIGKSPMQAGLSQKDSFTLRFVSDEKIWFKYDAASWNGASSTIKQKEMHFHTRAAALDFCTKHEISFVEIEQKSKKIPMKSYTDTILNS